MVGGVVVVLLAANRLVLYVGQIVQVKSICAAKNWETGIEIWSEPSMKRPTKGRGYYFFGEMD